jgi:uncharacterized membrane protein
MASSHHPYMLIQGQFFFTEILQQMFFLFFYLFFVLFCVCSRWSGSSTAAPTSTSAATAMGKQRMATSA